MEDVARKVQLDLKKAGVKYKTDEHSDLVQLWKEMASINWYGHAHDYWQDVNNCTPDISGVLGGFESVNPMDVADSKKFLAKVKDSMVSFSFGRAIDCGAGIGRVTSQVLLPVFEIVDLLEQSPRLLEAASEYISNDTNLIGGSLGKSICKGMQEFNPIDEDKGTVYDLFWCQWVMGHLTDIDFISFLKRCKKSLSPNGVIVLKENNRQEFAYDLDREDNTIMRCDAYFKSLFNQAGFKLLVEVTQTSFPEELYPVKMYAIVPK